MADPNSTTTKRQIKSAYMRGEIGLCDAEDRSSQTQFTIEQWAARRIRECYVIMSAGCGNAGPGVTHLTGHRDPLDCAECAGLFVRAVRHAIGDQPDA